MPPFVRLAAAALVLGACVVTSTAPARAAVGIAPVQRTALLLVSHQVRAEPRDGSPLISSVRAVRPISGRSTILPVLAKRTAADGRRWLRVRLPGRVLGQSTQPRTGWMRASGTVALSSAWHVLIRLSSREVIVFHEGRRTRTFSAVVGTAATPTPRGEFFVEEGVRLGAREPGGPFAFALSARSEVLQEFEGGPGQVAIHGRRLLGGQPGTAVSHGCVRISDRAVWWLARRVGRGVPVTIR